MAELVSVERLEPDRRRKDARVRERGAGLDDRSRSSDGLEDIDLRGGADDLPKGDDFGGRSPGASTGALTATDTTSGEGAPPDPGAGVDPDSRQGEAPEGSAGGRAQTPPEENEDGAGEPSLGPTGDGRADGGGMGSEAPDDDGQARDAPLPEPPVDADVDDLEDAAEPAVADASDPGGAEPDPVLEEPDPVEEVSSRFVQTEDWMEADQPDAEADFESTRNTAADDDRRPETSEERAPHHVDSTVSSDATQVALDQAGWGDGRFSDKSVRSANQTRSPLRALPQSGVSEGNSGRELPIVGSERTRRRQGAVASPPVLVVGDVPVSPVARRLPDPVDPEWWEPMASRVRVAAVPESRTRTVGRKGDGSDSVDARTGATEGVGAETTALGALEGRGEQVEPEARDGLDEGVEAEDMPLVPEEAGTDETTADGVAEAEEVVETDEPLGATDEQTSRGRPLLLSLDSTSAQEASPRVIFDDPEELDEPRVAARRTERAVYLDRVYDILYAGWNPSADLPLSQRALGVSGDVTVRLVIEASGRIRSSAIIRASGNPYLDHLALEAIPRRLPRFHAELEREPITYEITFRSR